VTLIDKRVAFATAERRRLRAAYLALERYEAGLVDDLESEKRRLRFMDDEELEPLVTETSAAIRRLEDPGPRYYLST
jgi:hypothetical protein